MSNTDIPAQEVDLSTKRQRLYHATWLNRIRLDKQLRPLLRDLEQSPGDGGRMGVLFKATFRGAVALVNHYLHFDIREHPSAILLIMLKLLDDRSFDDIWNDYAPMIKWVNKDNHDGEEATNTSSEISSVNDGERGYFQLNPSARLSDANGWNEGIRQDTIQHDTTEADRRQETDSYSGLET